MRATINVDLIYLDFAKAFDKVSHSKLIDKLERHGISGKVKDWVSAWLRDRFQRTRINGVSSCWKRVSSGVPQGSVLGPILFLLYINDLECGVMSWVLKFADDTKIFRRITSRVDNTILQDDLDKLVAWSQEWKMLFNSQKCKVMHFGRTNTRYDYCMNVNEKLSKTEVEKDLGVVISKDMKVFNQCSYAYGKANKMLGLIRRNIQHKNKSIMLRLYKSLVRPHVEYCSSAWYPYFKKDVELIKKYSIVLHACYLTLRASRIKRDYKSSAYGLWRKEETDQI